MKKKFLGRLLTMLLVAAMVFTLLPASAIAAAEWWGGDDGVAVQSSNSQPFANDSGVHYRIPAIVTLKDGTLVAATDQRNRSWGNPDDCRDIDTKVAVSTDDGASWSTDIVNDTGANAPTGENYGSGTYIDPVLATDGSTVYMLVDLFPGTTTKDKNCTALAQSGTGVDDDGNLLLRAADSSSYSYYLKDGYIYPVGSDEALNNYWVDENFDLYKEDEGTLGNLFDYSTTYFQPLFTSYLVFRTRSSNGEWSAPQIINGKVKNINEQNFLTAPGKGVVLSGGTIVFPCYQYGNGSNTYLIFGTPDANGNFTWKRSTGYIDSASEGELIDLGNGTLRYFMRSTNNNNLSGIKYVDFDYSGNVTTKTTSVTTTPTGYIGADLGALVYSKTSNNQKVVMVSCGTGGSRKDGYIFTFKLDSSNNMTLVKAYQVNSGSYSYSCMTELSNGSIGLLYENGDAGGITYKKLDIDDVTGGLAFDDANSGEDTLPETKTDEFTGVTATVPAGSTMSVEKVTEVSGVSGNFVAYELKVNNGEYTSATVVSIPVTGLNTTKNLYGFVVNSDNSITKVNGTLNGNMYTFTAPHLSVVGVAEYEATDVTKTENVTLTVGQTSDSYTVDGQYGEFDGKTVGGAKITAKEKKNDGTPNYVGAGFAEGTFYVSGSANDTAPSVQLTFEDAGNGQYYVKNLSNDTYIYPAGTYRNRAWTYSLGTISYQANVAKVNISYDLNSNTIYISKSVTSNRNTATLYLNLNGTSFNSSATATLLYLYTAVPTVAGYQTDITFTGVTVDNGSSIDIGNTLFNVTVKKATQSVTVQTGKDISFDDASSSYTTSNPDAADVKLENGKLTITGVTATTEPFTIETETTIYTVTVVEVPTSTSDNILVSANNVGTTTSNYTTVYAIHSGDPVTGLMLSYYDGTTGSTSFTVESEGKTVTSWETTDSAIATVSNGTIIATGVGNCYVIAHYADGTQTVIPVRVVTGNQQSTQRIFTIYSAALYHSELYCAVVSGKNKDSDWTKLPEGYVVYTDLEYSLNSGIIFAAKPDEGYALTYIGHSNDGSTAANGYFNYIGRKNGIYGYGSTSSDDVYFYYDYAGSSSGKLFSTSASGDLDQDGEGIFTESEIDALLKRAIEEDLNLDAAFHYTRQGNAGGVSLQFQVISDKLPTMEKKIVSVKNADAATATTYYDGMDIEQGDTINYEIVITTYKTHHATYGSSYYGTISYPSATLTDELVGMNKETVTLPTSPTTGLPSITDDGEAVEAETVTKPASFTLSLDNFDKVVNGILTNEASLEYTYNAQYSKGTAQASAEASAQCKIKVPTYIVDFGVPVTLTGRDTVLGDLKITGGSSANSEKITPVDDGRGIIYTPKGTFDEEADYVQLDLTGNKHYGIRIVPASNVLYEENFLTANNETGKINWTEQFTNRASDSQEDQKVGDIGKNVFGYDAAYATKTGDSGYYQAEGLVAGKGLSSALTTEFYGNGFDLIGNCGPTTGRVFMLITNNDGGKGRIVDVDTRYIGGTLSQVPLAHVELADAHYTVKIYAGGLTATTSSQSGSGNAAVYASGFAVNSYDADLNSVLAENGLTLADVEYTKISSASVVSAYSVAAYADTASTVKHEAGMHVEIDGFRVYRSTTDDVAKNYPTDEQNVKYVNILNAVTEFTAFVEGSNEDATWYNADEYELKGGPQNEIYLRPTGDNGTAIAFKAPVGTVLQISARVVENGKNATLTTSDKNHVITSNTEMYYTVTVPEDGMVTIKNTGTGMLALGNLKIKNGTTVSALSEEDYPAAIALLNETVTPAEPEQPTFDPEINVTVRSIPVFRNKLVTLTITTSTDVTKLMVGSRELHPTNSWLVKMGWSKTYTYVMTDTIKKGDIASYEIVAYNADGATSTRIVNAK